MIAAHRSLRRLARHRIAGPLVIVLLVLLLAAGALYVAMHDEAGAGAVSEIVGELWLMGAFLLLALAAPLAGPPTKLLSCEPRGRAPPVGNASASVRWADAFSSPLRA